MPAMGLKKRVLLTGRFFQRMESTRNGSEKNSALFLLAPLAGSQHWRVGVGLVCVNQNRSFRACRCVLLLSRTTSLDLNLEIVCFDIPRNRESQSGSFVTSVLWIDDLRRYPYFVPVSLEKRRNHQCLMLSLDGTIARSEGTELELTIRLDRSTGTDDVRIVDRPEFNRATREWSAIDKRNPSSSGISGQRPRATAPGDQGTAKQQGVSQYERWNNWSRSHFLGSRVRSRLRHTGCVLPRRNNLIGSCIFCARKIP